jgi:hypothetical protein
MYKCIIFFLYVGDQWITMKILCFGTWLKTPNYELIDDDEDKEVHAMVAVMDVQHSYHRPRRSVPRELADGEARIIRH